MSHKDDNESFVNKKYDFIIIGGGTSGLVLASRLTEKRKFNVLLLEAGTDQSDNPLVSDISRWMDQKYTFLRWNIFKKKDDTVENPDLEVPVPKMLGGGTSANAGGYERGNAQEWNKMAELVGDESWKMKNLDKYFKKIEDAYGMPNDLYKNGTTPLYFGKPSNLVSVWDNLAEEKGLPISIGFTDTKRTYGLSFEPVTVKNGERQSTVETYYERVSSDTLTLLQNAQVSNLVFDKKGKRTVIKGVKFYYHGKCYEINAKNEVILSAGAILSPFILKQSNLPDLIPALGKDLYDSASFVMLFTNNIESNDEIRDVKPVAMLSTDGKLSDTLIILNASPGLFVVVVFAMLGGKRGYVDKYDKNPYTMPKVSYDLLDNDEDMEKMIKRVEMVRELMNSEAMSVYQPVEILPGQGTDLRSFISENIGQAGHLVGTCKMGRDDDKNSVVDTDFKVKGIDGLRIVDASIIPTKQDMGTMSAALVIGEKAYDIISSQYRKRGDDEDFCDCKCCRKCCPKIIINEQ